MKSFTYFCQINSLSGVILSVIYFMYIFAITGDSGDLSPFFLLEIFLTRVGSVFIYIFLYTTLAFPLSYPFWILLHYQTVGLDSSCISSIIRHFYRMKDEIGSSTFSF